MVSREEYLYTLCTKMKDIIPKPIDLLAADKKIKQKGPISPTDIVLLQELERFNILLNIMDVNIEDLSRALKGEIGMS